MTYIHVHADVVSNTHTHTTRTYTCSRELHCHWLHWERVLVSTVCQSSLNSHLSLWVSWRQSGGGSRSHIWSAAVQWGSEGRGCPLPLHRWRLPSAGHLERYVCTYRWQPEAVYLQMTTRGCLAELFITVIPHVFPSIVFHSSKSIRVLWVCKLCAKLILYRLLYYCTLSFWIIVYLLKFGVPDLP